MRKRSITLVKLNKTIMDTSPTMELLRTLTRLLMIPIRSLLRPKHLLPRSASTITMKIIMALMSTSLKLCSRFKRLMLTHIHAINNNRKRRRWS
jgi:hypothetical protein